MADPTPEQRAAQRVAAEPLVKQAKDASTTRDFEKAREIMAKAIEVASRAADLHAMQAWFTFNNSKIEQFECIRLTMHHLDYAKELDPNEPLQHFYRGRVQSAQGNKPAARLSLETALKLKPDFPQAKEALDVLNGVAQAAADTTQNWQRPQKKSNTRAIVLGVILVVVGGGYGTYVFATSMVENGKMKTLKEDLNSTLVFTEAPQDNGILWLSVTGEAWSALGDGDKQSEMATLGASLEKRKLDQIVVFAAGHPSASVRPGNKICIRPECVFAVEEEPKKAAAPVPPAAPAPAAAAAPPAAAAPVPPKP